MLKLHLKSRLYKLLHGCVRREVRDVIPGMAIEALLHCASGLNNVYAEYVVICIQPLRGCVQHSELSIT